MAWQRARTDEKKRERRDAIYAAAFTLLKRHGYESVSFNSIATQAGFTKSNLYRYYSSREEIFLSIFSDLFEAWVEDCLHRLRTLEEGEQISRFAKTWVNSMKTHTQFLDLTPLLFISLEKNSSFEQLCSFKRVAKDRLYGIAIEIQRIYPSLTIPDAFRYLNLSYAASTNFWAGSTENQVLDRVYQMEEFREMKMDFENDLAAAIEIILRGLEVTQKQ